MPKRGHITIVASLVLWTTGCALFGPGEPVLPAYPGADRPIDLYAPVPDPAQSPIESGSAAIQQTLRDDDVIRHLQAIDARYSGRRRTSLFWQAAAAYRTALDLAEDEEEEEEDASGPTPSPIAAAVESDGGYWAVEFSSNVRETRIFYVCELALSMRGERLGPFDEARACAWRNR